MRNRDPRLPGFDTTPSTSSSPKKPGSRVKWRCHRCREVAKSWAAAQRHADEHRHYRIEVVFNEEEAA